MQYKKFPLGGEIFTHDPIYVLLKKEYLDRSRCEVFNKSIADNLGHFLSGDMTYLVLKRENCLVITPGCSSILGVDFGAGQYSLVKGDEVKVELSFYLALIQDATKELVVLTREYYETKDRRDLDNEYTHTVFTLFSEEQVHVENPDKYIKKDDDEKGAGEKEEKDEEGEEIDD